MAEPARTVDSIIQDLTEIAESGKVLDRKYWLDMAEMLAVLRIGVADKKDVLEFQIDNWKLELVDKGKSVAYANLAGDAHEKSLEVKKLRNKLYSIDELIRIAKQRETF